MEDNGVSVLSSAFDVAVAGIKTLRFTDFRGLDGYIFERFVVDEGEIETEVGEEIEEEEQEEVNTEKDEDGKDVGEQVDEEEEEH